MEEILLECRPSALGCRYEVLFQKEFIQSFDEGSWFYFIFYCYLSIYVTYKNITLLSGLSYQDDYIIYITYYLHRFKYIYYSYLSMYLIYILFLSIPWISIHDFFHVSRGILYIYSCIYQSFLVFIQFKIYTCLLILLLRFTDISLILLYIMVRTIVLLVDYVEVTSV